MSDAAPSRWSPLAHGAALAVLFVALFAWTFGKWPDVMVDFGRELYVPWQMVAGKQLYRDLSWFNGPLSPHWNAMLFRLFGVGLATLVWANAALFVLLLALLHSLLRSIASRGAATAACAFVLCVSGFGQLVGLGNYNYICPYSHETTHGMLLAVAALVALQRWRGRAALGWVCAAGLCVGLAFLTKPELFVAALAGASASLGMHAWSARAPVRRAVLVFALGLFAPVVGAWLLQWPALGPGAAWRATLGAWPELVHSDVSALAFYREGMGLDVPGANLAALALGAGALLALSAALGALAWWGTEGWKRAVAVGAAVLLAAGTMWDLHVSRLWLEAGRPWPLLALAALSASVVACRKQRGSARWPGAVGLSALALLALAKMLLNARWVHYGFVLAMPATVLVVVALWDWLGTACPKYLGDGLVFRSGVATLLAGFSLLCLAETSRFYAQKKVELGQGADTFEADVRGLFVLQTLQWIDEHYPHKGGPGDASRPTLAAFPEGVMLNYLARLENPTPYFNFMPPEIVLFGEETILAAFRAHPPDIVLLTHKKTSEYGLRWFGKDYARELYRWVTENYESVALFGDPPLGLSFPGEVPPEHKRGFGIRVFVRTGVAGR